ncbi:MAG: cysteine desulfurase [Acidobacteria bacterium Pan2503]|uniref:cysteine desulfurase n=1 Tax=Candidatus Acidiferrum panamense TaxID=2741543 RepID=A0A7V8NMX5_9BACT|nr:cysteine desulfurase [Candidatus Acidoferrum panamensis]
MSTPRSMLETGFDVEKVREDFPVLKQTIHAKPLVYLDSAATAQKPFVVIDAIRKFHEVDCANIHRGVHELSQRSTAAYEETRGKAKRFLNARSRSEVIFVRGTTEGINLVASTWGRQNVSKGDEIIISALEHHSNIVPWQMLCEEKDATLRVIPMNDRGELILEEYEKLLGPRTRLVAVGHVSNALGTINPVRAIVDMAHGVGALALIDGAQAAPHMKIDVGLLDADFYTFSGHKVFGPTGIGVLYGKAKLLDAMPPYQGGGDMIRTVTFEKTTYNEVPYKFEAGTPNIAGGIGMGAALDYVTNLGLDRIAAYEHELLVYGTQLLSRIPGLRMIGTAREKAAVLSFVIDGIHPHDIGTVLDRMGIAVRTGHHCAQPVMDWFRIPATTRASLAFYNTTSELDALADGLRKVKEVFG